MFKLSSKIKKSQSCTQNSDVVVCRQLRLLVWRDETQQWRYQVDGKWKDDCTVLLGCNAVERLFGCGRRERKIMFVISIVDIVYSLQHRLHDKQCERDFTWRYRSCKAAGLSHIVSAASLSARADFISPSAAITFARASLLGMKKWRWIWDYSQSWQLFQILVFTLPCSFSFSCHRSLQLLWEWHVLAALRMEKWEKKRKSKINESLCIICAYF